jgi:hypothetical protein
MEFGSAVPPPGFAAMAGIEITIEDKTRATSVRRLRIEDLPRSPTIEA